MRDLIILFIHLVVTVARLCGPGGTRSVVAESLLVKHQLVIAKRLRVRSPRLHASDRIIVGLCAILIRPSRLVRSAIVLKPSTILTFHRALVSRKYHLLFAPKNCRKPGPPRPSPELIAVIVEMKRRNPRFGYQRIADQISLAFSIDVHKDVVRRVLERHYRPSSGSDGPSWLTFLGHNKDSLWSVDLFRCESMILQSHWVMVVMDQFTRQIIGFSVHAGPVDGPAVCRLFNRILGTSPAPQYLSSDNDPLFKFHRWKANLRILDVAEVKTVPYVPLSHPFVERLIGTVRREFLDPVPFWGARDLERKLRSFKEYYNCDRTHRGLLGAVPELQPAKATRKSPRVEISRWKSCCRGLYQLPVAA